jgi:hypothetical protein
MTRSYASNFHMGGPGVEMLKGWKAIAGYLGIPAATAQRWARDGMPVRKEGRFAVAEPNQLREWLGRESHMPAPAQVMTGKADVAGALKDSITALRRARKKPKNNDADSPR